MKPLKFGVLGLALFALVMNMHSQAVGPNDKIKVLIVDGQNNHAHWPKITFMLKQYLDDSGLFVTDVARTAYTWEGDDLLEEFAIAGMPPTEALEEPKADPGFRPRFSEYDVVINNFGWNAAPWPEETQQDFETYIEQGGGLVVFHAADNSFPDWEAYNRMIGLGGWGDRTEKDGPYVYYNDDGVLLRDETPGRAGAHGPEHSYVLRVRNADHPITQGMPEGWLHVKDELYERLRGPAENMEILASAYADPEMKGSGHHEPAIMVLKYGEGRIFHTIMGHADYSVSGVGFIATMLRGTEWAATGKVTQKLPVDFPGAERTASRTFEKSN